MPSLTLSGLIPTGIMVGVGLLMTSTSLILRLVARYKQKLFFGIDDYLAGLAWFIFLGVNIATIYGLIQEAPLEAPFSGAEFYYYEILIYRAIFGGMLCNIVSLGCGRLSAVFFFRRIFYTTKQDVFDILTKLMIGILLLWTIGFFLSTLLACGAQIDTAATGGLDSLVAPGDVIANCISENNQYGLAISSLILDFLVLVLPLPKIWTLHTPRARKIAISSVFLIAIISLTASCLRVVTVFEMRELIVESRYTYGSNTAATGSYFYQLLETAACLIAINMPSIWYFSHHLKAGRLRRIFGVVLSYPLLKNESTEISDSEAILTRRAHIELETSHTPSQDSSAEKNDYRV